MSNVECIRNTLKDVLGWTLLVQVVLGFLALGILNTITPVLFASIPENATSGWIAESRCICICPHNLNYTDYYNTTLFTRKVYEPAECSCELTLPGDKEEEICLRCSCSYESRNAALIGAIVYGMLVMVFVCMPVFTGYVCVVPFARRKQSLRTATSRGYSQLNEGSGIVRLRSNVRDTDVLSISSS
ncbi:uncharacterized protein LOC135344228 [Halichondria panicea]|uniref:uncharacterized protein LOC135344228 n=1 Tax=Halichondria panicea TaxID=6063 RepID=UPI00312B6E64